MSKDSRAPTPTGVPKKKRKRGRPAKLRAPKGLHYVTPYRPAAPGEFSASQVALKFRRGAETCSDEHLRNWYAAIADAIEQNNAALVGHNALGALSQLNALWRRDVEPLARIGEAKLAADDKKRGPRRHVVRR